MTQKRHSAQRPERVIKVQPVEPETWPKRRFYRVPSPETFEHIAAIRDRFAFCQSDTDVILFALEVVAEGGLQLKLDNAVVRRVAARWQKR